MINKELLNELSFIFGVLGKMEYELTDGSIYLCEDIEEDCYKISYIISVNNRRVIFASATDDNLEKAIARVLAIVDKAVDEMEVI